MTPASSFVVIVEFLPKSSAAWEECRSLLTENASASLRRESGCRRFDVVEIRGENAPFYLYEIYDDEAAFELHLGTDHYRDFSIAAERLFDSKTVHVGVLAVETEESSEFGEWKKTANSDSRS